MIDASTTDTIIDADTFEQNLNSILTNDDYASIESDMDSIRINDIVDGLKDVYYGEFLAKHCNRGQKTETGRLIDGMYAVAYQVGEINPSLGAYLLSLRASAEECWENKFRHRSGRITIIHKPSDAETPYHPRSKPNWSMSIIAPCHYDNNGNPLGGRKVNSSKKDNRSEEILNDTTRAIQDEYELRREAQIMLKSDTFEDKEM